MGMITDPTKFTRVTVLDTMLKNNYVLNDITFDNNIELRVMTSESNEGFHDEDLVLIEEPWAVYCENVSYMIVQKFIDFYIEEVQLADLNNIDVDLDFLAKTVQETRANSPLNKFDLLFAKPPQPKPDSPWNTQVGGTHYTDKAMQPLQLTLVNRGYEAFSGACYTKINKYTTRAKDNEVEQLKKARHVLDLWIYEAEQEQQSDES